MVDIVQKNDAFDCKCTVCKLLMEIYVIYFFLAAGMTSRSSISN